MKVKRGDLIWLNPRLSIELGKSVQNIRRPYVVISNNKNNQYCPTINIACLTTKSNKANYPMHVFIRGRKYNLQDSVICCEQILTVNKNEIKSKFGSLDEEDISRLNHALIVQVVDENYKNHIIEGDNYNDNESKIAISHKKSRKNCSNSSETMLCRL